MPRQRLGPCPEPERSQFSQLFRHFLERFFNHETASPDGDAKARLVLIAFATGLPGHLWLRCICGLSTIRSSIRSARRSVSLTVADHLIGCRSITTFSLCCIRLWQWASSQSLSGTYSFPTCLIIFVLTHVAHPAIAGSSWRGSPPSPSLSLAFCSTRMSSLPWSFPRPWIRPNLSRFLAGHLLAVTGSGLFAAAFILALQGVLLSVLGERLFRRLSLVLAGTFNSVLLMLLLLFPVLSGAVPDFLQSGNAYALCFPPFWFLGIYQRLLEGPSALPIYCRLAQTGCVALCLVARSGGARVPACILAQGAPIGGRRGNARLRAIGSALPLHKAHPCYAGAASACAALSSTSSVRLCCACQRYRIYLVLYGGVGLSVVAATILRLSVVHRQVRMEISSDGIRAAIGIVAFWVIAGLRMAFVSSGNQQGSWVFRIVHGRPPHFRQAMEQLLAAKVWVLLWGADRHLRGLLRITCLRSTGTSTWPATASQLLVAAGMCLLLTDILFLNVKIVAFHRRAGAESNPTSPSACSNTSHSFPPWPGFP